MEWTMPGLTRNLQISSAEPAATERPYGSSGLKREGFGNLFLILKAYSMIIRFDRSVARGDFRALYDQVREFPLGNEPATPCSLERTCSAVDIASIWYWKQVGCLARSASTVCLLRSRGVQAQLVIGAQRTPFKAHAWVEVDGQIVNDKPYMLEIYAVLDRC
jgi:transglutaminase superfamily protein